MLLASTPAHALLKIKRCAEPLACKTLARAVSACKPGTRCTAMVKAIKALEAPTKCQRARAADKHAFSLCDDAVRDRSFALLSHLDNASAKQYFCSVNYKHLIIGRKSLAEQYAYAYAPYDPNSEDDEIGAEKPDFFASMTDCRAVKK